MLITGNSRKILALEIHCANDFFAQNDIAKKVFAENSCVELTLLKNFRGNFCESKLTVEEHMLSQNFDLTQ